MTRDETTAFLLAFAAKVHETADMPLEERAPIIQAMFDEFTDEQKLVVVNIFQAAGGIPKPVAPTPAAPPARSKHRHKRRPATCPLPSPVPAVGTRWECPKCGVEWEVGEMYTGPPQWLFALTDRGKKTGQDARVCR